MLMSMSDYMDISDVSTFGSWSGKPPTSTLPDDSKEPEHNLETIEEVTESSGALDALEEQRIRSKPCRHSLEFRRNAIL